MKRFDVAVIGLGAMGSAAAFHLARRGRRVLGLDRFRPPHTSGSSHGQSRIIRQAYWEDPTYVPLLRRAYTLWRELEGVSGADLMRLTGILLMGVEDGEVVPGASATAREHGLDVKLLAAADVRARWPQFRSDASMSAVLEREAGAVFPERCIRAHLEGAQDAGATLRFDEPATSWRVETDGVVVETASGSFEADRLVVAAGAWAGRVLAELGVGFTVERQVQYWFPPKNPGSFLPEVCPVFAFEPEPGRLLYGFPDFGSGVKAAIHHEGEPADPDTLDRSRVAPEEVEGIRRRLRPLAPDLDVAPRETAVCLYTNTPDRHFVIDRHPDHDEVVVAAGFSGHGFKFASVVGEIVADVVEDEAPPFDLDPFRIGRLLS